MSDDDFLSSFHELRLPLDQFGHLNHLRLAWLHLQRATVPVAVAATCGGIRAYAIHHGVPGKFHWTMTEALMRLMHAWGASERALDWDAFIGGAPTLHDARACLAQHYSDALLATPQARVAFVAPDRLPLP